MSVSGAGAIKGIECALCWQGSLSGKHLTTPWHECGVAQEPDELQRGDLPSEVRYKACKSAETAMLRVVGPLGLVQGIFAQAGLRMWKSGCSYYCQMRY